MTKEARKRMLTDKNKKLTDKEKAFTKEYAKTLNGTQSALAVYDTVKNSVAGNIASDNLMKPHIREEIERLLANNDIELGNVLAIHKRNLEQDKHLPTSQKAVNDYYELIGLKSQPPTAKVNIAFVIEK